MGFDSERGIKTELQNADEKNTHLRTTAKNTMGARYGYLPIHHQTEIRILEIQPPDPENVDVLREELNVVSLPEQPFYEACSYCWGDPVFSEKLFLGNGGEYMLINHNLAAELRQLRHPDRRRRLWADAVCINQKDNVEKSAQVILMNIY